MIDMQLPSLLRRVNWRGSLAVALGLALIIWAHFRFVVGPLDYANKDFMSLWSGATAVLQGLNPYDEAVWTPLRAAYGSSWMPDPRAPFPLWTFLVLTPFALLPIPAAAAVWLTVQELLLALSAYLIISVLLRRTVSAGELGLLVFVSFTSPATLLVQINGQMTFLLLAFLALFLILLDRERPFLAGASLALLALKPNPFIVLVPLLGLWLIWHRRWRVVGGAASGGATLLVMTWVIQPGWLMQWLAVRSKTEVVTITPTLWGLAAELSSSWWLIVGLGLSVILVAGVGYFIFARPGLGAPEVTGIALAASLLVTPYTWAYEHALLFLPWLWLFGQVEVRRRAQWLWLALAGIIPWLVFGVALVRVRDSLGFIVPLATLLVLMFSVKHLKR